MAQDETYTTRVYLEQGGDRAVAGSGGVFAAESGGSVAVYSGAQMTVESGANLALAGANLAGLDARKILISNLTTVIITASSTRLSVLNLPANVRTVILSLTSNCVSASFWLTSVSAGREVFLMFGGTSCSTQSAHVQVSLSGCTLLGSVGLSISTFGAYVSATSNPQVLLYAVEDNVWSIVSEKGDING